LRPAHLALFVHTGQAIDEPLDGAHHGVEKSPFAIEHAGHEHAERLGQSQDCHKKRSDLNPAIRRHR